jgi:hypothetical protein
MKISLPKKPMDYIIWGVGLAALYVIVNNLRPEPAMPVSQQADAESNRASRVTYYTNSSKTNGPLPGGVSHVAFANAYIGDAYHLGQTSMTGDYNGIPMADF